MTKICTWNVNGIRSRKNLAEVLKDVSADVFCIQETKIPKDQINESLAFVNNEYTSCFAIPTQQGFKGRSGCVTYYLNSARPYNAEYGFLDEQRASEDWKSYIQTLGESTDDIKKLDAEGRLVITCHDIKVFKGESCGDEDKKLFIFNVYFPRLDPEREERVKFKYDFNRLIEHKLKSYLKDPKSHVIIACDLNIQHKQIDSFEVEKNFDDCVYRKWLTQLLTPDKEGSRRHMVDSFRMLHEDRKYAYTCWPTVIPGSRENNYGYRIDLMLLDSDLAKCVKDVYHLTRIKGSDHCPVLLELTDVKFVASKNHPPGCTRTWPQFKVRQTSLKSFFTLPKRPSPEEINQPNDQGGTKSLEPGKKLKPSSEISSQVPKDQTESNSPQVPTQSSVSSKLMTGYEKIMQTNKKSKASPPKHCNEHGLICEAKVNKNKKSKNFGRRYYKCPDPHCSYFRWIKATNT